MSHEEAVIEQVRAAFAGNRYPGDPFLQGSFDGCEPYDEVSQFFGRHDWAALEPGFLDARHCALGFFSEAGFRFFLPAYLIADLQGRLLTADPVFHLTHGLATSVHEHEVDGHVFVRRSGPHVLLNPRRYGAMTWSDHARQRLSVFTREEARAIVAYLQCRQAAMELDAERSRIEQALDAFWLERARTAPTAEEIARHLAEEAGYAAAIRAHLDASAPPTTPTADGEGSYSG